MFKDVIARETWDNFSLHHINLVVCAVWSLTFDDPMTTNNYDDTPEVEGRLHKKKRCPFNHGIPDWQADFFWTKLYIFLWMKWNEIQYIWVFFLQTWRPHFIHDEPLEFDWGNLGNSMVHFGAPNGRWNWTDSSLRDGIRIHRWLLDDKTHKGCQTWFRKKKGVNSPVF